MVSEYEIAVIKGDAVKARNVAKSLEPNSRERLVGAMYVNELAQRLNYLAGAPAAEDVRDMLGWVTAEMSSFMRQERGAEQASLRGKADDEAYRTYMEARNTLMRMDKAAGGIAVWKRPAAPKSPGAPDIAGPDGLSAKAPNTPKLLIEDSMLARDLESAGFAARGMKSAMAGGPQPAAEDADVQESPEDVIVAGGIGPEGMQPENGPDDEPAEPGGEPIEPEEGSIAETGGQGCEPEGDFIAETEEDQELEQESSAVSGQEVDAIAETWEGRELEQESSAVSGPCDEVLCEQYGGEAPHVSLQELEAFECELDRVLSEVRGHRTPSDSRASMRTVQAAPYGFAADGGLQAEFDKGLRAELKGAQQAAPKTNTARKQPQGRRANAASAGARLQAAASAKRPVKKTKSAAAGVESEKPESRPGKPRKGWLRRLFRR